jgi:hypothetical protein
MPCKYCKQEWIKHYRDDYDRASYCPVEIYTPGMLVYAYEPMTNLEYLEYQYEKTQVVR